MSGRNAIGLAALVLAIGAAPAQAGPPEPAASFDIAITIDDLPVHGLLPKGMTRVEIARQALAALKQHGVGQVYGFVNAVGIAREPESAAVLPLWRKAGYPLGNHTYSHMNLASAASLPAWEQDVTAGEPVLRQWMAGQDWHVLRLPNLTAAEGERQAGAFAFMKAQHYRLADVSLAFGDWNFSDAYARCTEQGNTQAVEAMEARYLRGVDASIAQMKAISQRVYGRAVPQVLLLHLGGFTARMLPATLDRLERAGGHYVTLEKAQSDPAYDLPGGGHMMVRTARARGISLADIPAVEGTEDAKNLCR